MAQNSQDEAKEAVLEWLSDVGQGVFFLVAAGDSHYERKIQN